MRGEYLLTVTWELPRSGQTNLVELAGVQALGVEREAGYVAVIARPPLQVTDQSAGELLSKIDVRELPQWTGRPDTATVLVYRYLRPGYKLALEARRYDEAEVLQGLIDNARLATVVADDGQVMTEAHAEHPQQRPAASGDRAAGEDDGLVGVRRRIIDVRDAGA